MRLRLLSLLLPCLLLTACAAPEEVETRPKQYQATFLDVFDTVTTVMGYAESQEVFTETAEMAHDLLLEYHQLYDIYNDYEGIHNLKTVNDQAGISPVTVDARILDLLLLCRDLYADSGGKVDAAMDALDVPTALIAIFEVVQRANKYIDETAPWVLAKSEETKPRLEAVLYNLCDALRTVTVLMQAYLPNTAPKMAEQLGLCDLSYADLANHPAEYHVHKGEALFPRIDVKKEIEYLEAEDAKQLSRLAENLDCFTFIVGASNYEEVGIYVTENNENFSVNSSVEKFFDYKAFGKYIGDAYYGKFVGGNFIYNDTDTSLLDILYQDKPMTMGEI